MAYLPHTEYFDFDDDDDPSTVEGVFKTRESAAVIIGSMSLPKVHVYNRPATSQPISQSPLPTHSSRTVPSEPAFPVEFGLTEDEIQYNLSFQTTANSDDHSNKDSTAKGDYEDLLSDFNKPSARNEGLVARIPCEKFTSNTEN